VAALVPEQPRHSDEQGFTLIELLIGLTIAALLAGLLLSGLQIGTRSEQAVNKRVERISEIAAVHGFLRAQLANARPVPGSWQGAARTVFFDGRTDHVTFLGVAPGALAAGGLQTLALGLVDDGRGHRSLVVRWRPYDSEPALVGDDFSGEKVLLDQVAAIELGYFGALEDAQPAAWQSEWVDMNALPSIVTMRLVFTDRQAMPDCVVALRAGPAIDSPRAIRNPRPWKRFSERSPLRNVRRKRRRGNSSGSHP
jgi:general secretion pathway protein J